VADACAMRIVVAEDQPIADAEPASIETIVCSAIAETVLVEGALRRAALDFKKIVGNGAVSTEPDSEDKPGSGRAGAGGGWPRPPTLYRWPGK
jgi:hypothetical protein